MDSEPPEIDLHALGAAVEDLFQRDLHLVDHRRVLVLPAGPQALGRRPPPPPAALPREAELSPDVSEGVVLVHVHALLGFVVVVEGETVGATVAAAGAEKHVERVGASEEGGESGVGVSMEGVVVRRAAGST